MVGGGVGEGGGRAMGGGGEGGQKTWAGPKLTAYIIKKNKNTFKKKMKGRRKKMKERDPNTKTEKENSHTHKKTPTQKLKRKIHTHTKTFISQRMAVVKGTISTPNYSERNRKDKLNNRSPSGHNAPKQNKQKPNS